MKSLSLLLGLVLILFNYACNSSDDDKNNDQSSITAKGDGSTSTAESKNLYLSDIPDSIATDMLHYYHIKRVKAIKEKNPVDHKIKDDTDTRYMWFDTSDLKYLVEVSRRIGGDGIRFYFGVYPKLKKKDDYPEDQEEKFKAIINKQTLVMVPTKKITIGGKDYHADVRNANAVDEAFKKNLPKEAYFIYTTRSYNHGELCPPPNPCVGDSLAQIATSPTYSKKRDYN